MLDSLQMLRIMNIIRTKVVKKCELCQKPKTSADSSPCPAGIVIDEAKLRRKHLIVRAFSDIALKPENTDEPSKVRHAFELKGAAPSGSVHA